MGNNSFPVDFQDRAVFFGASGEGKTELVKYILRPVAERFPVLIGDSKALWCKKNSDYAKWNEPGTIDHPRKVDKYDKDLHVQIIQPEGIGSGDTRLDAALKFMFDKLEWALFYLDDTEDVADEHHITRPMRKFWKSGRAKNLAAWVSSQTFSGIPKMFKTQAEVRVAMRVGDEDVKEVAKQVHVPAQVLYDLPKFHWIYFKSGMRYGEVRPPIPYAPPAPISKK